MPRETTGDVGPQGAMVRIEILPVPEERAELARLGYRTRPVELAALLDTGASHTIIPVGIGNAFGVRRTGSAQSVGLGIGNQPVAAKSYLLGISVAGIDMPPLQVVAREIDLPDRTILLPSSGVTSYPAQSSVT